jgi:dynein heavy chain
MTNEPPLGLRANLLGSWVQDPISDPEFFGGVTGPNAWAWKPMLFGLCFFHAVIQERRGFGPIGWNIAYGFNTSDLLICVRQLRNFLEMYADVPMEALCYTVGECNYGGRVTDDKDRRCLNAILRNFYNEDAIQVGYQFQRSGVGQENYVQPQAEAYEDYIAALRGLPTFASPEVFGLHANAAITKELKETRELFDAILLTQSRSGGGSGGGDTLLAAIAEDISSKLPGDFDLDAVKAMYPVQYLQSMNTVLSQELIRFNRLIVIIRASLNNLKKAIKGLVVMDAELEGLATALVNAQRPAMWMKRSYPSLKPLGGYVGDLMRRLHFFQDWIDNGMPADFWISGFFFTQAFLTGAMQNYARSNQVSIDLVDFAFHVLTGKPGELPAPEDGVNIYGLFLEGARYDANTKVLAECEPKVLFTEIPMMWFQPMEVDKIPQVPHYNCPLYKESARRGVLATTGHSSNFVMYLKLPSDQSESHWVKRGVAGLCALDD